MYLRTSSESRAPHRYPHRQLGNKLSLSLYGSSRITQERITDQVTDQAV